MFFEWMIFLGCRVHMGQQGSPGLLRGIFRGRSYLNSWRPETQPFTLPGQVLKRESAGIMGTECAVEPKGSRGDLTVWLGGPLTVRQDQDYQQVYFHWYFSCCHTHLLKKKNLNTHALNQMHSFKLWWILIKHTYALNFTLDKCIRGLSEDHSNTQNN